MREEATITARCPGPVAANPPLRSFAAGTPLAQSDQTALLPLPAMLDGLKMEETLQSALEPLPASFPSLLGKCWTAPQPPEPLWLAWQPFPQVLSTAQQPEVPRTSSSCYRLLDVSGQSAAPVPKEGSQPCLLLLPSETGGISEDHRWEMRCRSQQERGSSRKTRAPLLGKKREPVSLGVYVCV